MFKGETSANLMGGCKDQTSSRGFEIALTDKSGNKLSQRHYVRPDPPGSAWTLSRTKLGSNYRRPQECWHCSPTLLA